MHPLLSMMSDLPLIADGPVRCAMCRPLPDGPPAEALNVDRPETVAAAHRAFHAAGAGLHRTNTLGANALDLARHGLAERCEAINNSGSAAVRQAIGTEGIMMGSVGPIGAAVAGRPPPQAERERAYSEQMIYLSDTGADVLVLEHFRSLAEAKLAVAVAGRVSDAPVLALLALDARGRTAEGALPGEAAEGLLHEGAQGLGISCGPGGEALSWAVGQISALGPPVAVMLGVGSLGEPTSSSSQQPAERFADALSELARQGAAIVGGCCGVAPVHIEALAERLGRAPKA
ncbi:MAG: homocysteine S-methyltransferase family protein [SAR324 cluster bacterium]|nr:homocysteine S-methyltransferase family protein [SAR324 cluster bacterium]